MSQPIPCPRLFLLLLVFLLFLLLLFELVLLLLFELVLFLLLFFFLLLLLLFLLLLLLLLLRYRLLLPLLLPSSNFCFRICSELLEIYQGWVCGGVDIRVLHWTRLQQKSATGLNEVGTCTGSLLKILTSLGYIHTGLNSKWFELYYLSLVSCVTFSKLNS